MQIVFPLLVAVAAGGLIFAVLAPFFAGDNVDVRVRAISEGGKAGLQQRRVFSRPVESAKDNRRKQVQETLKQIEDREKQRKRMSLRMLIAQSGLDLSIPKFWAISGAAGVLLALGTLSSGVPWFLALLSGFVGFLGLPRWFLGYMRKRRQEAFLSDFADAIDVMVRGLKAGLPVSDAMKVIASESGPPVGPEFQEVVEGQRIGITVDQGLERMFERMPVQEVNFLAIVMSIQSKTGGNLTETLSNLSKVLRERRKMKNKVQAVSQEAKSSAAIIGSLPFAIIGIMTLTNPGYLDPMFVTPLGKTLLVGSGIWMLMGILVMRKMINFEI